MIIVYLQLIFQGLVNLSLKILNMMNPNLNPNSNSCRSQARQRYDAEKGRLRGYLRMLTNARVVDLLRKERPIDHQNLDEAGLDDVPAESDHERHAFRRSLLAMLIEELRAEIPMRQFEIFERVKLKNQSPEFVAEDLGITRAMIDRNIYKVMTKLRQLAQQPEYKEELAD